MKYPLMGVALAAMLLALPTAGLRAQDAGEQERVVFAIPNVECAQCVGKISEALKGTKGVANILDFTPQGKRAVVVYTPAMVSVHQLAETVADTPGLHGKPYRASMLVRVNDLGEEAVQQKASEALKKVAGVESAAIADEEAGIVAIQFASLPDADKTGGPKGATQAQIMKALQDAGLTATAEVDAAAAQ